MKGLHKAFALAGLAIGVTLASTVYRPQIRSLMVGTPYYTTADRLAQYGDIARARMADGFAKAGVAYPPQRVLLLGLKQEKRLEIYAATADGPWHYIKNYPVLGASGHLGPKRRQGDMQVPEGFYQVESLNPNSMFHLALRVSYPNELDKKHAAQDGIEDPGGDIMIHGSNGSVGCLAMGDVVAEDLFVLAAETGHQNVTIILSPVDFREQDVDADGARPKWVEELYAELRAAVKKLPTPAVNN